MRFCRIQLCRVAVLLLTVLLMSSTGRAQTTPSLLGDTYSGLFDISFKPFANAKTVERQSVSEIARFTREDKQWLLVFTRTDLPDEAPLKDRTGPNGQVQAGYLTAAVNTLRSSDTASDVLRNEIIDLGDLRIGVIAAATHDRTKPILLQQAMMEVTPKLYYRLAMTCPLETSDVSKSVAAQEAATVFKAILDSIERVDLSGMKKEQDERLIRTRGLWVAFNRRKIVSTASPDRYLRFKQNGRDIGYAYVVEELADGLPKAIGQAAGPVDADKAKGIRVGVRTHTLADGEKTVDVESWMYVTFDRTHESWSTVTIVTDPAAKNIKDKKIWFSELGNSDLEQHREFDKGLNHEDFTASDKDGKTLYRDVQNYTMNVRNADRNNVAEPLKFGLPPWYLPQALGSMLPRLVPLDQPTGYLFAGYNSGNRKIMHRYVDVLPDQTVKIDGTETRAIGVSERIGYGGTKTTHYFTRKGDYLGTVNADTRIEIVPTDRATLTGLWKDADLRAPAGDQLSARRMEKEGNPAVPPKPTPADLIAAKDTSIPDLIAPDLRVLFCGINPGLWSGATGHHFARPGNRFWPALHAGGFTPRVLKPWEEEELLTHGCGISNFVNRTTATAAELSNEELVAGAHRLEKTCRKYRPAWLALLGIGAYRTGFGRKAAAIGPQVETIGDTRIWVLPNPSGLNAHHTPASLGKLFADLHAVAFA